jgi:hypothetical protein
LANRRLSPKAQEKLESNQAQSGRRKGCGKDARFTSLEIPSGFPTAATTTSALRLHIKWLDGER